MIGGYPVPDFCLPLFCEAWHNVSETPDSRCANVGSIMFPHRETQEYSDYSLKA